MVHSKKTLKFTSLSISTCTHEHMAQLSSQQTAWPPGLGRQMGG